MPAPAIAPLDMRRIDSHVVSPPALAAMSVSAIGETGGIREVTASGRSLIPLQTRLRYTTMILLPEDEEILDAIWDEEAKRARGKEKPAPKK